MKLSEQFEEALIYAGRAHCNQTRKQTGIPYIAHILGVGSSCSISVSPHNRTTS